MPPHPLPSPQPVGTDLNRLTENRQFFQELSIKRFRKSERYDIMRAINQRFKEGLMAKFKPYKKDQLHLLPHSLEEYVSEGHMARMIYEVVEGLDTSGIEARYSELGQNTYHPKIILKLLFYGYATGVRSGRKIALRCESDTAYMYLSEMYRPDFRTINDFRKNNLKEMEGYFVEVVRVCKGLGMVKLGDISIDGSKLRANASSKRSKDKESYEVWLKNIEEEIRKMLKEAWKIDQEEDEIYRSE